MIEKSIICFFSVYAPQTGLPEHEKDKFYNDLLVQTAITPAEEFLLICGDLNGHVGKDTEDSTMYMVEMALVIEMLMVLGF